LRVLKHTAGPYARALAMPNLKIPIAGAQDVIRYREEIEKAARELGCVAFQPLMTIYLTDATTRETIIEAYKAGAFAAKMYIRGTTTNSDHGVSDPWMPEVFGAMEEVGMVLCVHGEIPHGDVLDWESAFIHYPDLISQEFPRLRIVLEHITTSLVVDRVLAMGDNVAATITAHHLCLIHNDVVGFGRIQPHHFCMPIAKRAPDREALIKAATGGHPKFFFGSDTAPHMHARDEGVRFGLRRPVHRSRGAGGAGRGV
jgi:dihydroorotase